MIVVRTIRDFYTVFDTSSYLFLFFLVFLNSHDVKCFKKYQVEDAQTGVSCAFQVICVGLLVGTTRIYIELLRISVAISGTLQANY